MFDDTYGALCTHALTTGKVTATLYRRGAIIKGWPSRWPYPDSRPKSKRGIIRNQTRRSLIRAGWAIANAPLDFDLMTTLTFREPHEHPKDCLRTWCRAVGLSAASPHPWAWVQEYQGRGVVHYHVLHCIAPLREYFGVTGCGEQLVSRRGQPVRILTGSSAASLCGAWMGAVGDTSAEFEAFQRGGTTEYLERPELAGYYMGRYVGKEAQKELPDDACPQGRWWYVSEAARPVPRGTMVVSEWSSEKPHRLLFDWRRLFPGQFPKDGSPPPEPETAVDGL